VKPKLPQYRAIRVAFAAANQAAGRSPQRGSWSWSVQWNWAETRRATGSRKFVIQAQLDVAAACERA
jgi:hypothetical protein